MATSPNYGWLEPDNTDLVKNGALAIRTLGNAIDATMATMTPKSIVDAKGDLIAASAADTPARLAVGANDLVLSADSAEATGLKYTGGWTSYTPTLTNLTLGNGALTARWRQIGKMVDVRFTFQLGSTSAVGNDPTFTLPKTSVVTSIPFNSYFQDAGTATYVGFLNLGSTTATFYASNSNGVYTTYSGVGFGKPIHLDNK